MSKIYLASFNRASDGAISKLKQKMIDNDLYTDDYKTADYILAVGDRKETLHFVIDRFAEKKKIIHLWAGEVSQGTHDEIWRSFITQMSMMQLCTNREAQFNVIKGVLPFHMDCRVIGNIMLDNLEIAEKGAIDYKYILVLYNPPTTTNTLESELIEIHSKIKQLSEGKDDLKIIWLPPNGDAGSDIIMKFVSAKESAPRSIFLRLLKDCEYFITNSSCQYYEAPFVMNNPKNIIQIGIRNSNRESKYSNMSIPNASDNVIKILKELK